MGDQPGKPQAPVTAVQLLDPAIVVLGGGLALAGPALFDPVRAGLEARLRWRPAPEIRPARHGSDASRAGAALLAWRLLGDTEATGEAAGDLQENCAVR
ncbi:MAG: ROK family protein [Jatrophihabitantaceae bacterium]